jgi:Cu/Ag efflux protein CusF
MNTKAIPVFVMAGLTALSASAYAAAQTKTGDVKSTDIAKHELTLNSGDTFSVPSGVKLDRFKAGDKVAITYETKDGKMVASKVHHAK